jgi:DeoR/GlpR family transcriptional regulator of sugar metabolism
MESMKKRHQAIIEILKTKPFLKIEELCRELNVSPATIRRDLKLLEEAREILRINGGAMYNQRHAGGQEQAQQPAVPHLEEKIRIAEAAAEFVKEGDTIFLDAGSTNRLIAERLAKRTNITVITNSLEIAYKLHHENKKDRNVIICGGALGEADPDSIVGPVAEKMISMFRANLCIIGALGVDIKQGITDSYLTTARIKENMIEHSNKVLLVADHSKFGVINTAFVCSIDKIDYIITDQAAPAEEVRNLRTHGIAVTLV